MRKLTGYVTDREGNAVAGAEVYIRKQSDNSLLTLYSDDGVTTTANPLSTDNDGEWSAFFADNTVKIQIFTEGVQQQEINNYQHFDLDNISAFIWTLLDDADAATARATLGVAIGSDVQAYDAKLAAIAALADPNADRIYFWDDSAGAPAFLTAGTGLTISGTDLTVNASQVKPTESFVIACSDETTALAIDTGVVTFRMPYAFTLSAVRASVTTAPTGAAIQVDINEGGVSVLSTPITIDATEKTSTTAATPAVISDASLADDAEISIDIDAIGSTIAGAGLKVCLIGTRT